MGKQKYPQNTAVSTTGEVTAGGKRTYSSLKSKARKAKRKEEAEARQKEYNKLTVSQRIARAKKRRGKSTKEIARLSKPKSETKVEPKPETNT